MTPPPEAEPTGLLAVGERVERYVVEAKIGEGGLAVVYRVRHVHLDTVHALKVLMVTTPIDRARLLAEGQVQARLHHPNVVAVSDVLTVHRSPALVMEWVDGPSLAAYLAQAAAAGRRIPADTARSLFRGIVAGVGAAHAVGLVHRDLKPANILLKPRASGVPIAKVTDFGLVRSLHSDSVGTLSGAMVGTPAYMAPEQIRDPAGVDTRADLWALGALLYELLHGQRAFDQDDTFELYRAISAGAHPPIHPGDARWTSVIADLLQVDPDQRIASCAELWGRLWDDPCPPEWSDDAPMELTPVPRMMPRLEAAPAPPFRPFRPFRPTRRPWARALFAVAVSLAVAATAAAAGRWLFAPTPLPPPAPAPATAPAAPSAPEPAPAEPVPERPRPSPVSPPPTPAHPPAARLDVRGDAAEVWLVAPSGRRVQADEPVPIGEYSIHARWDDGEARVAGRVTVPADGVVSLRCSGFLFACAVIPEGAPTER